MGYFCFWLNESIAIINAPNVNVSINPSNTVISATPLPNGNEPTTLESPILLLSYYTIHTFLQTLLLTKSLFRIMTRTNPEILLFTIAKYNVCAHFVIFI